MLIRIFTPAPRGSRKGNRVTAERWASLLRELGHRVIVSADERARPADVFVALHARHGAAAVQRFSERYPGVPVVVALTGTDLYIDVPRGKPAALASLARADRLIVLQPGALAALSPALAAQARVVPQSVPVVARRPAPRKRTFDVCVVGHLRNVKDPMRTALASRRLPPSSRVAVLHAGGVIEERFAAAVRDEMARNPRYRWLGELTRPATLRLIARSRALVISSRAEGGAHVVGEALVAGTPILASAVSGNVGMLGADYPGYFPVGDTGALTALLLRLEDEPAFVRELEARGRELAPTYHAERERAALAALCSELS